MIGRWENLICTLVTLLCLAALPLHAQAQIQRLPSFDDSQQASYNGSINDSGTFYESHPVPATATEPHCDCEIWTWQMLPDSILYHSYLAGIKEPRLGSTLLHDETLGWVWDHSLGARVGFIRYGSPQDIRPEGWQLDVEGSAYLRQDPEEELDVVATDFRVGVPLTYARGPFHTKLSYYHTSSHLGDEFQLKNPAFNRINYVRDALVFGLGCYVTDSLRVYGEAEYAFKTDGGAEPWALQFGAEYSPQVFHGFCGTPFLAVNGRLREEFNFSGSVNVQTGWQWRTKNTNGVMRIGLQYYNGKTPLFEFFDRNEELIGAGIWYDF